MIIFWGFLGFFLLCATFGAWRQQFHEVEKHNLKRPDFQYSPDGSEISPDYRLSSPVYAGPSAVWIKMSLRFVNRGEAPAYNIDGAIYGCWVNDDPPTVFVDRGQSVGRTNPGERIHRRFVCSHLIGSINGKPVTGDAQMLVLLYELKAHAHSRDGELFENEPIWLIWHPGLNNILSWARPADVEAAAPHIQRFKEEQAPLRKTTAATQPS